MLQVSEKLNFTIIIQVFKQVVSVEVFVISESDVKMLGTVRRRIFVINKLYSDHLLESCGISFCTVRPYCFTLTSMNILHCKILTVLYRVCSDRELQHLWYYCDPGDEITMFYFSLCLMDGEQYQSLSEYL